MCRGPLGGASHSLRRPPRLALRRAAGEARRDDRSPSTPPASLSSAGEHEIEASGPSWGGAHLHRTSCSTSNVTFRPFAAPELIIDDMNDEAGVSHSSSHDTLSLHDFSSL